MRVEFIENPIKVKIIKSEIPILFLDSNILIELNKINNGSSTIKYQRELKILSQMLFDLTQCDKLMVPIADQELEIDYRKNKNNNIEILFKLSNGNKFQNSLIIEREQKEKLFEAFTQGKKEVSIHYTGGFSDIDKKSFERKTFIKGIINLLGTNIIDELRKEKQIRTVELIEYQKTIDKKETFKEHLVKEFLHEGLFLNKKVIEKITKGERLSQNENNYWNEFVYFARKYQLKGDLTEQIIEYCNFQIGFYWFAIPFIDIERNMNTYISLFQKFEPGDYVDIVNASRFLPYCNYYITDNKMCRILKELEIDKRYNVKIYSLKTINDLIDELKNLY